MNVRRPEHAGVEIVIQLTGDLTLDGWLASTPVCSWYSYNSTQRNKVARNIRQPDRRGIIEEQRTVPSRRQRKVESPLHSHDEPIIDKTCGEANEASDALSLLMSG